MTILTRSQYRKAVIESLFKPVQGHSLACLPRVRFDRGKYKETLIDKPVNPIHAETGRYLIVWAERRKDKDGPYYALFCHLNPSHTT